MTIPPLRVHSARNLSTKPPSQLLPRRQRSIATIKSLQD